jgi:curli biogenesis system outer membrane secretion channel CsgG
MKSFALNTIFSLVVFSFTLKSNLLSAQASNTSFETLKNQCKGIKREDRIRITVARFSVSSRAAQATGAFGEELTAILTNAIQQTNCFRVLQSVSKKADWDAEIGYNESGATNGSGPDRGKQLGAQAIVTAEITEYNEGKSTVGGFGLSMGNTKAKLGISLSIMDPQSRDILWTESVSGEAKKNGFNGASLFGINVAGSNKVSEAMSAAVEDLVFNAVEKLVKEKDEIISEIDPHAGMEVSKVWNTANCSTLKQNSNLKVMVIVPETHIQRPIPDPAGETEIIRKFIEAGFKVIDPAVYATLRSGAKFKDVITDPMAAASFGRQFGADILIYGEAFSQTTGVDANTTSCRARIEVKAVRTDNGQMVAADGKHAGGQDLSEAVAAKTALRNAGSQMADYILEQMCTKALDINTQSATASAHVGTRNVAISSSSLASVKNTTIEMTNANFMKFNTVTNKLKSYPKLREILTKELANGKATIALTHSSSDDDIAVLISGLGGEYEVIGVEDGKVTVTVRK